MTSSATSTVATSSTFSQWRLIAVVTAVISLLLLLTVLSPNGNEEFQSKFHWLSLKNQAINGVVDLTPHRKLLISPAAQAPIAVDKPARFWGDTNRCAQSDIQVSQGPGEPLPSGIPTYIVDISNACGTGCDISDIHLHCGWFSSARLVDPSIFKRVGFNDCLVNGGKPLRHGQTLSFQYANIFSYQLGLSSANCV